MGYLEMGALAGASGEFLKQSEEGRKNKYQEIRDRRLADLTTKENIRAEGVKSEESATEREFRAGESRADREAREAQAEADRKSREKVAGMEGDYTLGRGQERYDSEGNLIASGPEYTHAPNAASTKAELEAKKTLYRMKPDGSVGAATTWEELEEQYYKDPDIFTDETGQDEFGNPIKTKVRKPGTPGVTDYINRQLHPDSRVLTDDLIMLQRDPDRMWEFAKTQPEFKRQGGPERAMESIRKIHKDWNPLGAADKAKSAADRTEIPTEPGTIPGTPLQKGQGGAWSPAASAGGAPAQAPESSATQGYLGQSMNPEQLAALKEKYGR